MTDGQEPRYTVVDRNGVRSPLVSERTLIDLVWNGRVQPDTAIGDTTMPGREMVAAEIPFLSSVFTETGRSAAAQQVLSERRQKAEAKLREESAAKRAAEAAAATREHQRKEAAQPSGLICTSCGAGVSRDWRACPACGRKLYAWRSAANAGLSINAQFWGTASLVVGITTILYFALFFDPSVPGDNGARILNLGLMSDRQNGLIVGCALLVVGAIVMAAGLINRGRPS